MACLLPRITSMKLQNNWYVWQINLHLSSSCIVAHTPVRPPQSPSTNLILVSCYSLCFLPQLPSCFCSFLFNCLPPGDFWPSSSSFPSGDQVIAMLPLLFWSCLSICLIIFHLCCFTSLLIGFVFHLQFV